MLQNIIITQMNNLTLMIITYNKNGWSLLLIHLFFISLSNANVSASE